MTIYIQWGSLYIYIYTNWSRFYLKCENSGWWRNISIVFNVARLFRIPLSYLFTVFQLSKNIWHVSPVESRAIKDFISVASSQPIVLVGWLFWCGKIATEHYLKNKNKFLEFLSWNKYTLNKETCTNNHWNFRGPPRKCQVLQEISPY